MNNPNNPTTPTTIPTTPYKRMVDAVQHYVARNGIPSQEVELSVPRDQLDDLIADLRDQSINVRDHRVSFPCVGLIRLIESPHAGGGMLIG